MSESSLRRALKKAGYLLHKSRKVFSLDNLGGYMIVDGYTGAVVAGSRYELSLEDVVDWMNA